MFKKENGITLVALVVTIVILLILAGVTISMTVSQNGLFGRAKNASATYSNASANEQKAFNDSYSELDNVLNQYNLSK